MPCRGAMCYINKVRLYQPEADVVNPLRSVRLNLALEMITSTPETKL